MSSFSHDLSGRVSFTIKSSLTRCWIFSRAQNRDSSPLTMKITGLLTGFLLALVLSIIICEGFNVISNPSLKYRTPVKLRRQKLRPSQILPSSNNNNEHYPFHHRELFLLASSSAAADGNDSSASSSSTEDSSSSESSPGEDRAASIATNKDLSLLQRLKKPFAKKEEDDGLTFRQRLAKMGLAAVLSYGMVSNISYSISVSLAWYIFSSRVRIDVAGLLPNYVQNIISHFLFSVTHHQNQNKQRLDFPRWRRVNGNPFSPYTQAFSYSITSFVLFD